MPCTDTDSDQYTRRTSVMVAMAAMAVMAVVAMLSLLSSCSLGSPPSSAPVVAPSAPRALPTSADAAPRAGALALQPPRPQPPPSASARNWADYRMQAARRLVAANPGGTYMGVPPEPLLAIPVLEVELNGDGSVRHITVLRRPSQATDTVKLAIDAVHRAAPFGDVSRLPRPWKFAEVFLFNDDRRFKPRTLDH